METTLAAKEIDMSLVAKKRELPAQLPYLNNLDLVADEFGSRREFVQACKVSTVPAVLNFVKLAEETEDTLDELCLKSGMTADKLLEYVVPALYRWNGSVAKIINAINTPKTVKAGVESALLLGPEGLGDRKIQYQMAGLIGKEGANLNVFNTVNVGDLESFEDQVSNRVIDVTPREQPAGAEDIDV